MTVQTSQDAQSAESADVRGRWRFFQEHAGYATPPGRAACALELAKAERAADTLGWELVCESDADGWAVFGDDRPYYVAVLVVDMPGWNQERRILATLGGVDVSDAEDADYWRVMRAELAAETIAEHGWETLAEDARCARGRRD